MSQKVFSLEIYDDFKTAGEAVKKNLKAAKRMSVGSALCLSKLTIIQKSHNDLTAKPENEQFYIKVIASFDIKPA